MPYSYLFGNYFYQVDIIQMIEEIEEKRKNRRALGKIMKTTFAEDLKNKMMGIDKEMDLILERSHMVSTDPNF